MCTAQTKRSEGIMPTVYGALLDQLKAKKAAQTQTGPMRPVPVRTPPTGSLLGTPIGI